MIRLHVLDNDKVQLASAKTVLKVLEKQIADCFVYRIKKYGDIISKQI